jgi:hypothetical protein
MAFPILDSEGGILKKKKKKFNTKWAAVGLVVAAFYRIPYINR